MPSRRTFVQWGAALASGALGASAWAQGVPVPAAVPLEGGILKVVVPYAAGGASDRAARLLADALGPRLAVPVVVENRVGAGGRLAVQQLHRDSSGQNQVVLANPATMLVAPLVFKDNGYDPDKDYVALSQITSYQFGLAVSTAVPVKEFAHLHAWMLANQDKLAAGVPATGSLPHFFALMLAEKLSLQLPVVGYRGSAPLLNDLMGGHVPIAVDTLDALEPLHKAGKLRILAVSGEQRSPRCRWCPPSRRLAWACPPSAGTCSTHPRGCHLPGRGASPIPSRRSWRTRPCRPASLRPTWCLWSVRASRPPKCCRPTKRNGRRWSATRAFSPDSPSPLFR